MFAKAAGASLAGACDAMTKETALHLAIKGKHLPCAELLAKNGKLSSRSPPNKIFRSKALGTRST